MQAEAATKAGASFGGRSPDRNTYRNGYRARPWGLTRVGVPERRVSRICQELDAVVYSFLSRPLDGGPSHSVIAAKCPLPSAGAG